jgi:ABC-type transport system involved in cytochrome bd biosynthesis fused ATPase/permease subunit
MTVLHILVLVAGLVGAIALTDVLGHRDIGPWPVGILALALIPVAGLTYSPWLAALSLGVATGTAIMMVGSRIREITHERQIKKEARERRQATRDRQLERIDPASDLTGPPSRRHRRDR